MTSATWFYSCAAGALGWMLLLKLVIVVFGG